MDGNKVECGQIRDGRKNSCKRENTIMRVQKERKNKCFKDANKICIKNYKIDMNMIKICLKD